MSEHTSAAMIVIGNEILSGKVADSNSPFLARELRELGVALERVIVIPDSIDVIGETVRAYSETFDFVFTSGGVGPTHDDITIAGIAHGFGVEVVHHPGLRETIQSYIKGELTPAHLKMAEVPEGSELVAGEGKTFPTVVMGNVYILPGIPEIFEAKIEGLRERFRTRPYFLRQVLVSEHETNIAEYLDATLAAFPELLLGSYPKLQNPRYRVRLTLESTDEGYLEAALADLVGRMPAGFVVEVLA